MTYFLFYQLPFDRMNKNSIATEIANIVSNSKVSYSGWTIGVTDKPTQRKSEHGDPGSWHQWNADSETDARAIESHFIDKGMKGGSGGLGSADYVYIF